jgi:endoplasmic reticulum-Golgi intermediate compartment protein 3
LHVDVIDSSGAQQINVGYRIHKTPVDSDLTLILPHRHPQLRLGETMNERYTPFTDNNSPFYCGSCYDANVPRGECCNTCQDVLDAYKKSGLPTPSMEEIEQCGEVLSHKYIGCNMYGDLKFVFSSFLKTKKSQQSFW